MEPIRSIVAAADFGELSTGVLAEAVRLAKLSDAQLTLIHVVIDLESMLGVYVSEDHEPLPDLQTRLEREAQEKLATLRDAFEGLVPRLEVRVGMPWSEIVGCAIHERADLIVLGQHDGKKPSQALLGSTVDRVLRQAPCPVVVVPEPMD